jgi:hypothetical protein
LLISPFPHYLSFATTEAIRPSFSLTPPKPLPSVSPAQYFIAPASAQDLPAIFVLRTQLVELGTLCPFALFEI